MASMMHQPWLKLMSVSMGNGTDVAMNSASYADQGDLRGIAAARSLSEEPMKQKCLLSFTMPWVSQSQLAYSIIYPVGCCHR